MPWINSRYCRRGILRISLTATIAVVAAAVAFALAAGRITAAIAVGTRVAAAVLLIAITGAVATIPLNCLALDDSSLRGYFGRLHTFFVGGLFRG